MGGRRGPLPGRPTSGGGDARVRDVPALVGSTIIKAQWEGNGGKGNGEGGGQGAERGSGSSCGRGRRGRDDEIVKPTHN